MLSLLPRIVVVILLATALLAVPSYVSRHPWRSEVVELRAEVTMMRVRNEDLQRTTLRLVEQLHALERDPLHAERVMGARLGAGARNEVIVRLEERR